ncbi:MAG: hypothetical protein AAF711_20150 [Planctomycetota bacterium]
MKSIPCHLPALLFLFVLHAQAEELRDGLYTTSRQGDGRVVEQVNHPSGQKVRLDRLLTTQLSEARLISQNNDNSRYRLSLYAAPFEKPDAPAGYVVVVGGQCYGVASHSSVRKDGRRRFGARVNETEHVQGLAKVLDIQPERRTHPGHRTLVTLEQKHQDARVGGRVVLLLRIKNVGGESFTFLDGGMQRGARNNQFSFVGFDHRGKPMPDVGDPMHFGGIGGFVELEPGGVFEKAVDATKWFEFSEPGAYRITAAYQYDLFNGPKKISEGLDAIWRDHAVAQTRVVVYEREDPAVKQ